MILKVPATWRCVIGARPQKAGARALSLDQAEMAPTFLVWTWATSRGLDEKRKKVCHLYSHQNIYKPKWLMGQSGISSWDTSLVTQCLNLFP